MSDLSSQYAEEVETFRHILDLSDPRETMSRSSTTVLGLDNEKGQQELNSDFAKICISPKPSGAPMARFPYKFLRNLSTKLGRISLPSVLRLPLQRLLPLVTLLWRSVRTVLSLPSKGLKSRFRRVPILKKLPGMATKMTVTILKC